MVLTNSIQKLYLPSLNSQCLIALTVKLAANKHSKIIVQIIFLIFKMILVEHFGIEPNQYFYTAFSSRKLLKKQLYSNETLPRICILF